MRFALSEEHHDLAAAARSVLDAEAGPTVVRAAWDSPDETLAEPVVKVWERLHELGVAGLLVPSGEGGLGLDEIHYVALMEEVGRSAVPLPVLETACAAPVLTASPHDLRPHVDGSMVAWSPRRDGLVPWGRQASAALIGGGPDERRVGIVRSAAAGSDVETVDRARPVTRYTDGDVTALDVPPADVNRLWLRGVVGTAAALVGLARRMIDMTTTYVAERTQFGVPVGSFQAVKHRLADVHIDVEFARPAVLRAAWELASDDAVTSTTARDVSMAKLLANKAASATARAAIQCHGGMGYTTEHDLHLFAKRAWALAASFGTDREHRDLVGETIGLGGDRNDLRRQHKETA